MLIVKKRPTKKKPIARGFKGAKIRKSISAWDRIEPIGFDEEDGIKINLYGKSGTGKTTLWSTFPAPILAIICSGGDKPGELRSINTLANRKRIKQVVVRNCNEVQELVARQREEKVFATVVLDHGSGLQDLALKEILGLDELPAQGSWGMASRQDWGQCALQMKERFRSLLSLDCNVVIVAQEREFNTDSDNEILMPYVGSALTPSVTGWLAPACDYICQTFIKQKTEELRTKVKGRVHISSRKVDGVDYCLRTGPHETFMTKFRLPKGVKLPEFVVDPDYDKLKALIEGE